MQKLILIAPLLLGGCITGGPIIAADSNCSGFIPSAWRAPVPGADLPEGDTVGDWISFGDRQTGQLDKANGRQADTLYIIEECEKRAAQAVKRSKPKFLGIF